MRWLKALFLAGVADKVAAFHATSPAGHAAAFAAMSAAATAVVSDLTTRILRSLTEPVIGSQSAASQAGRCLISVKIAANEFASVLRAKSALPRLACPS